MKIEKILKPGKGLSQVRPASQDACLYGGASKSQTQEYEIFEDSKVAKGKKSERRKPNGDPEPVKNTPFPRGFRLGPHKNGVQPKAIYRLAVTKPVRGPQPQVRSHRCGAI